MKNTLPVPLLEVFGTQEIIILLLVFGFFLLLVLIIPYYLEKQKGKLRQMKRHRNMHKKNH